MACIDFKYGQVVEFASLSANTIALDGAVQGPQMDPATRRFSFDHHGGCIRMLTLATCQQVATALHLGLVVDADTEILVNDIDADTVLSVWLLLHPKRAEEPRIAELVDRVGKTDAHGTVYPAHWMHYQLSLRPGENQTVEKLYELLMVVTDYANGRIEETVEKPRDPCEGYGWDPENGWRYFQLENGFEEMYQAGVTAGFVYIPIDDSETIRYDVAKCSDLVPVKIGPGSAVRPVTDLDQFDGNTLLGALALLEIAKNPEQTLAANWGGGSSIGGSPRNPDGSASKLNPMEVLQIFKTFTP